MKKKRTKPSRTKCIVYVLEDCDGVVRYVGQTRTTVEVRMDYHKKGAFRSGSPVAQWIYGELTSKRSVFIRAIDENATWDVSEILWIDRLRRGGAKLLNVTRGGADTIFDVQREGIEFDPARKLRECDMRIKCEELGIEYEQPIAATQ